MAGYLRQERLALCAGGAVAVSIGVERSASAEPYGYQQLVRVADLVAQPLGPLALPRVSSVAGAVHAPRVALLAFTRTGNSLVRVIDVDRLAVVADLAQAEPTNVVALDSAGERLALSGRGRVVFRSVA